MRRYMTLISSILAIACNAIAIFVFSLFVLIVNGFIGTNEGSSVFYAVNILIILIYVLGIIFNVFALCQWKRKHEKFKKRFLIISVIFNALGGVFCFFINEIMYIIIGVILFVACILFVIDLAKEGKRFAKIKEKQIIPEQTEKTQAGEIEV